MTGTVRHSGNSRLADLLLDPREALDVEIKGWLDLAASDEHKATLAKAILALQSARQVCHRPSEAVSSRAAGCSRGRPRGINRSVDPQETLSQDSSGSPRGGLSAGNPRMVFEHVLAEFGMGGARGSQREF